MLRRFKQDKTILPHYLREYRLIMMAVDTECGSKHGTLVKRSQKKLIDYDGVLIHTFFLGKVRYCKLLRYAGADVHIGE